MSTPPGPYRLGKFGFVIEMHCPGPLPEQKDRYLPHALHVDAWVVEQLNKAHHFDKLLEAAKKADEVLDDLCGWLGEPQPADSIGERDVAAFKALRRHRRVRGGGPGRDRREEGRPMTSGPVASLTALSRWLREVHDGQKDSSGFDDFIVPDEVKSEALTHSLELDRIIDTLKERGL